MALCAGAVALAVELSTGQNGTTKFGFELGYDKLTNSSGRNYTASQFNGNIAGMIWKSDGDDVKRKYDFSYDAASPLLVLRNSKTPLLVLSVALCIGITNNEFSSPNALHQQSFPIMRKKAPVVNSRFIEQSR